MNPDIFESNDAAHKTVFKHISKHLEVVQKYTGRPGQTDPTSSSIVESNIVGRGGQTNARCWIQHLGERGLGPILKKIRASTVPVRYRGGHGFESR